MPPATSTAITIDILAFVGLVVGPVIVARSGTAGGSSVIGTGRCWHRHFISIAWADVPRIVLFRLDGLDRSHARASKRTQTDGDRGRMIVSFLRQDVGQGNVKSLSRGLGVDLFIRNNMRCLRYVSVWILWRRPTLPLKLINRNKHTTRLSPYDPKDDDELQVRTASVGPVMDFSVQRLVILGIPNLTDQEREAGSNNTERSVGLQISGIPASLISEC